MTAAETERLTPAFAEEFLARVKEGVEERDVDAVLALCSEDLVYEDAGPSSKTDREGMRQMWTAVFANVTQVEMRLLDSFLGVDGDSVAAHWRFVFERSDLSEPIVLETLGICTFRDGVVCRWKTIIRSFDWMGDLWP